MNLIAKLKGKILVVLIVILTTLLSATYIDRGIVIRDRDETKQTLIEVLSSNKELKNTNNQLLNDLKTKPKEFITTTKEVMVEVCNSKIKNELIANLPKKNKEVVPDEKDVVDIDARLPDDLIRLLQ